MTMLINIRCRDNSGVIATSFVSGRSEITWRYPPAGFLTMEYTSLPTFPDILDLEPPTRPRAISIHQGNKVGARALKPSPPCSYIMAKLKAEFTTDQLMVREATCEVRPPRTAIALTVTPALTLKAAEYCVEADVGVVPSVV